MLTVPDYRGSLPSFGRPKLTAYCLDQIEIGFVPGKMQAENKPNQNADSRRPDFAVDCCDAASAGKPACLSYSPPDVDGTAVMLNCRVGI